MSEDTATLKDTVVSDGPPAATTTDSTTTAAPVAAAPTSVDNSEAAEIGQLLINSGYGKNQVNELIEAPGALASIRYAIENDPVEFLKMLQRTSPAVADRFSEAISTDYVNRYAPKAKPDTKDANSELMDEVRTLREKVDRAETEQGRRDAAAALAATQDRYKARVDDLFGQTKELNLTKSETRALRAALDSELSKDPNVVARCSKGNFVDVPSTFKKIMDEWSADKKAAVEAEKTAREKTSKGAFSEFTSGPNPFSVNVPDSTFDNWDNTEAGFAKALEQFAQ